MEAGELKKDYWELVRRTRRSGRISPALVRKTEEQWRGFDGDVVEQALRIHMERYRRERECYTLGIMRNLQRHKDNEKSRYGREG